MAVKTRYGHRPFNINPLPEKTQGDHTSQTSPNAFPTFTGTDAWRKFVFSKPPPQCSTGEVGKNVGNPHKDQNRQKEVDANDTRLRDGEPGKPEGKHAQNQP